MEPSVQIISWIGLIVTAFGGAVAGVRALIRGPKEDKALEADLQDKVTAMAERWLERAEERLKGTEAHATAAEARAQAAETEVSKLQPRLEDLEHNLLQALHTIEVLWPWGLSGGGDPRPKLPAWIFEWLHREGSQNRSGGVG